MANVVLHLLATIWIYSIIGLSFIATFLTQVAVCIVFAPCIIFDKKFRMTILGQVFRFYCACAGFYLNPFWRLRIVRPPPKNYKPSRTLLMCNHLSAADPWVVASALFPWELKYVFKANLLKIPIAGWAIKLAQDLPVYFTKEKGGWGTKPGSVQDLMSKCDEVLKEGMGIAVFPEGTRSLSGRLQPFKDGFFKFALQTECEILPCALHNSPSLWPLRSHLLGIGTAYFAFGDPIIAHKDMTVEELKEKVREAMLELIRLSPCFDEEAERPLSRLASTRGHGI